MVVNIMVDAKINIWNGVVICACILCNKMAYYIHSVYKLHVEKNGDLIGEVNIFENLYRGNALEKMEQIYV